MFPESYWAFVLFVMVMTGTPGAGNLSMMAIGQTTGFRSSLPFLAGTTVGAAALNSLVALGLGGVFLASSGFAWTMKIVGMAYILYLGWKLLFMQLSAPGAGRRFSFGEGLLLHPTNPKSWAMAVVGFSQMADTGELAAQAVVFVLTFMVFQVTFHSLWGLTGAAILRTLNNGPVLTCVNCVLTALMVGATAYAIFI